MFHTFTRMRTRQLSWGFEDADETESEVYMYVASTPNDLLHGKGQLYVFGAADNSTYNTWDDIYYSNSGAINGTFIPLKWNYKTQNETDLDTEAIAAGGFPVYKTRRWSDG